MHVAIKGVGNNGLKKIVDSKIPFIMIQRYEEDGVTLYDCHIIIDSKTRFSLNNINRQIARLAINDSVLYLHSDDFLEVTIA